MFLKMSYYGGAVGVDELKAAVPYFFGRNNGHDDTPLFIHDGHAIPVQFYDGNGHKTSEEEILSSYQGRLCNTSPAYQAILRLHCRDVSAARETFLSMSDKVHASRRAWHRHITTRLPYEKATSLSAELKRVLRQSLDSVIESAGL